MLPRPKWVALAVFGSAVILVVGYFVPYFVQDEVIASNKNSLLVPSLLEINMNDVLYILLFFAVAASEYLESSSKWSATLHSILVCSTTANLIPVCISSAAFWANFDSTSNNATIGFREESNAFFSGSLVRLFACIIALVLSIFSLVHWWRDVIIYRFGVNRRIYVTICLIGCITAFLHTLPPVIVDILTAYGPHECQLTESPGMYLQMFASSGAYVYGPTYFAVVICGVGSLGFIADVKDTDIRQFYKVCLVTSISGNLTVILLEQIRKIAMYALSSEDERFPSISLACATSADCRCFVDALNSFAAIHGLILCSNFVLSALLAFQLYKLM